jgi:hypothetical protein
MVKLGRRLTSAVIELERSNDWVMLESCVSQMQASLYWQLISKSMQRSGVVRR